MELLNAIASRRAIRSYKKTSVEDSKIEQILKAGCSAPIGKSLYDHLRITVVQNQEILRSISEGLKANMHVDFDPMYNAPVLILISSKQMPFPNIEFADAGCIMQNMMLEATEQGLGSVVIWGSSMVVNAVPDLKKALLIPDDYTAVSGIVVGYAEEAVEAKELTLSIHVDRI
ncbi:MAG TPA: nitroreductase family protein [Candidatus Mediterraneibacter norfolkensis]|nr:nitroreductase family protein [Candidatus Mediterraneibacter norfolkensis]